MRHPVEVTADRISWALSRYIDLSREPFDLVEPGVGIVFWDVRKGSDQADDVARIKACLEISNHIWESFRGRIDKDFDRHSTNDGNFAVCRTISDALTISHEIARLFRGRYSVRIACETNSPAPLVRMRSTRRAGGRALEYAERLLRFYDEIARQPRPWQPSEKADTGETPLEPAYPDSYILLSEEAFRLAAVEGFSNHLHNFHELDGQYTARVFGGIPRKVYLMVFPSAGSAVDTNQGRSGMLPFS